MFSYITERCETVMKTISNPDLPIFTVAQISYMFEPNGMILPNLTVIPELKLGEESIKRLIVTDFSGVTDLAIGDKLKIKELYGHAARISIVGQEQQRTPEFIVGRCPVCGAPLLIRPDANDMGRCINMDCKARMDFHLINILSKLVHVYNKYDVAVLQKWYRWLIRRAVLGTPADIFRLELFVNNSDIHYNSNEFSHLQVLINNSCHTATVGEVIHAMDEWIFDRDTLDAIDGYLNNHPEADYASILKPEIQAEIASEEFWRDWNFFIGTANNRNAYLLLASYFVG